MRYLRLPLSALGLSFCLFFQVTPSNYVFAQTFNKKQVELKLFDYLEPAKLSPDQKAAVLALSSSTLDRFETILTSSQKEQLQSYIQQGITIRNAIEKVTLSSSQKSELGTILQDNRSKLKQILTFEQKSILRQQFMESK